MAEAGSNRTGERKWRRPSVNRRHAGFGCIPTMYFPDRPVRDSAGISCLQLENPTVAERTKRINEMSAEIHARAALAESSRKEIARIAARKDRERANRARGKADPPADAPASRQP